MRRGRAEWLLLPLFLLPLLLGGGFVLFAKESYRAAVEDRRKQGAAGAETWLRQKVPDPASMQDALDRVRREFGDYLDRSTVWALVPRELTGPVPPTEPTSRLVRVRLPDAASSRTVWVIGVGYPGGLSPSDLSDPGVRLKVDTGTAPADLRRLDGAGETFKALLDNPDLKRLREWPVPVGTKLYLARRWARNDPANTDLSRAVAFLRALLKWKHTPEEGRRAFGFHDYGGLVGFRAKNEFLLWAEGVSVPDPDLAFPSGDGLFRLRLAHGLPETGSAVWRGRLRGPIAGTWTVETVHGDAWWRTPLFRKWWGPAAVLVLAFLLIPTALWISLRRRRRLDEARTRFITELAHDLRTPLTSVRLHADLMATGRVPAGEESRYVQVMSRESARLSGLLANLLDLSRLERRSRPFEPRPLALRAAVADAAQDFCALYPHRQEDLQVEGDADLAVLADRTALDRCLANLLDNAGKYTPPGTAIRVAWEHKGHRIRLRILDDGPGIPPTQQSRLFRRYVRGAASTTAGVPGTGIGLALVRELAEGMDGQVRCVQSDTGACFELELPRAS